MLVSFEFKTKSDHLSSWPLFDLVIGTDGKISIRGFYSYPLFSFHLLCSFSMWNVRLDLIRSLHTSASRSDSMIGTGQGLCPHCAWRKSYRRPFSWQRWNFKRSRPVFPSWHQSMQTDIKTMDKMIYGEPHLLNRLPWKSPRCWSLF